METRNTDTSCYATVVCFMLSYAVYFQSFDEDRRLVRTAVGWDYTSEDTHADYGAFMYQIREANKESENVIEFGCKTYSIICNTCTYI